MVAQLCRNRPEGFGPRSSLHAHLPTTCFIDVILEPLATWLFLAVLGVLLLLSLRIRTAQHGEQSQSQSQQPKQESSAEQVDFSQKSQDKQNTRTESQPELHHSFNGLGSGNGSGNTSGHHSHRRRRGLGRRLLSGLYYALVVAMFAMVSLEIARLVAADLGIGLLPFTYVGVLTALAGRLMLWQWQWQWKWQWRGRGRGRGRREASPPAFIVRLGSAIRTANGVFWLVLAVMLALKTAAVQQEQMDPAVRRTAPAYPTSDQALDNAVMVGVAVMLAALETAGIIWPG